MRKAKYRKRWYLGIPAKVGIGYEAFRCSYTPSWKKQGTKYLSVTGPFRTKRGALWAQKYGLFNPFFRNVNDAERMAKLDG